MTAWVHFAPSRVEAALSRSAWRDVLQVWIFVMSAHCPPVGTGANVPRGAFVPEGTGTGTFGGKVVPQPGRLHEHATALRRAASMAIWQCDALVHASYTAKLPGPVPQGELTLNAIEHFPWAVVSHAIVGVAVGVAVVGVAVGFAVVGAGPDGGFRQLSLLETLCRFTCLTKFASSL